MSWVEVLGYIATVFTVLSFTMKDLMKLRIINSIACSLFILYGYINHDFPLILVNILVGLINVFYLLKGK